MNELSKARVTVSMDRGVWSDGKLAAHAEGKSFSSFLEDLLRGNNENELMERLAQIEGKLQFDELHGHLARLEDKVDKLLKSHETPPIPVNPGKVAHEEKMARESAEEAYRKLNPNPDLGKKLERWESGEFDKIHMGAVEDDGMEMLAKKQAEMDAKKI